MLSDVKGSRCERFQMRKVLPTCPRDLLPWPVPATCPRVFFAAACSRGLFPRLVPATCSCDLFPWFVTATCSRKVDKLGCTIVRCGVRFQKGLYQLHWGVQYIKYNWDVRSKVGVYSRELHGRFWNVAVGLGCADSGPDVQWPSRKVGVYKITMATKLLVTMTNYTMYVGFASGAT